MVTGAACCHACKTQRSKQHTFILMTGTNESWTADRSCTCGCSCTHETGAGRDCRAGAECSSGAAQRCSHPEHLFQTLWLAAKEMKVTRAVGRPNGQRINIGTCSQQPQSQAVLPIALASQAPTCQAARGPRLRLTPAHLPIEAVCSCCWPRSS